jgi:TPR repeat protein
MASTGGKVMRSLVMIFLIAQLHVSGAMADDIRDGIEALDRKDFKRALQLIPPLAKSGDPFAQWLLGDMYKNGEDLPQDTKMALSWWTQAATNGQPDAQLSLGDSYRPIAEAGAEAVNGGILDLHPA